MGRRKKLRRRRSPKFRKFYKLTGQDDSLIDKERVLQKLHTRIANEIFPDFEKRVIGDWTICVSGIALHIDPVFGSQAEIWGTSNMPLLKRLIIHIKLLKLVKKGYSILKAVNTCLQTSTTQSKDLMNLKNWL